MYYFPLHKQIRYFFLSKSNILLLHFPFPKTNTITAVTSFKEKPSSFSQLFLNFAKVLFEIQEMKLIVVTPPHFFVEEDQIITNLFEEGLDILHLRKPETPAMYAERLLTLIPARFHKRIVTHEHFYLREEFGLMGIHLNKRNPNEPHDYAGTVSTACLSIDDLEAKKKFYDYVFLSDSDFGPNNRFFDRFTPEMLAQAKRSKLIDSKVMALGGINLDNIRQLKSYGFGGAVVMDDLWTKFDLRANRDYQEIIDHFKRLKEAID